MFFSPYRYTLAKSLSTLLPPGTVIKGSTLLQAYATFSAMKETGDADFHFAYKKVFSLFPSCNLARLHKLILPTDVTSPPTTFSLFTSIAPDDFFRFIIPEIVSNPVETTNLFRNKFHSNILLFAHHIIQINRVTFSTKECAEESYQEALDKLYSIYERLETHNDIRLNKSHFIDIYKSIYLYPLDSNELKIRPKTTNSKTLFSAIETLSNQLEIPREQRLDIIHRFYVKHAKVQELIDHCDTYNFTKNKDISDRKKLLRKALENLALVPPLDALCSVSIHKKAGAKHLSETPHIPNDITLENGLIYTLFTSYSLYDPLDRKDTTLFFPTPFFVKKWLADPIAKSKKVTFVFDSPQVKDLINYHYSEGTYNVALGKNITFLSYEQWIERTISFPISNTNILLFANRMSLPKQTQWFSFLKQHSTDLVDISVLLSSHEFEQARSPFSSEIDDPNLQLTTIITIPQGINNCTSPRRKIFLRCAYSKNTSSTTTKIHAFTLNTDLKTQALSLMREPPVEVKQHDLVGLYDSIRKLYSHELLARKAIGRQKVAAFSYEFTPDITIWCSKTYPPDNKNRPRLEAYVCTPAEQQRAESGFLDRGKVINETKKHTTKVHEDNISNWLEHEYPFSIMQARHTSKELKEITTSFYKLKPAINIREEIINRYGPLLAGENIALKTLWYLFPDLENSYSAKDYRVLERLALSEIGHIRIADISPEICEELFPVYFPEDTKDDLFHKLKILSIALDRAVGFAYCEKNLLRPFVQDSRKRDKLFNQVRNALTKKHFTEAEFLQAYNIATQKFNDGQIEYIGVIIRLLTGLESNVVCALKWKDIMPIADYSFSKIIVVRQVTNDGKDAKGFDSPEDYLCFPCTILMQRFLDLLQAKLKLALPDWANFAELPIVTTHEALMSNRSRYSAFPPRDLEQLSRELISCVGIPAHIVEIPDNEKGTKETNLNHYGGDFFRENFRYWALNKAKLTIDEVLYLIGNKPETTFGMFYCDYLNDASQLMLYVKLLRIDAFLTCDSCFCAVSDESPERYHFEKNYSLASPYPLQLRIRLTQSHEYVQPTIEVSCRYGLTAYVSPLSSNSSQEAE